MYNIFVLQNSTLVLVNHLMIVTKMVSLLYHKSKVSLDVIFTTSNFTVENIELGI